MQHTPSSSALPVLQQYLTFTVGQEMFALDVHEVREVMEYGRLTDVPMMPAFIKGVTNLRGSVIPVIDLSLRFGRIPSPIEKRTCIIIIECAYENQTLVLGVIADTVKRVVDVMPEQVESRPSFGANLRAEFIRAMLNINAHFVVVLAMEKVLSVDEMMGIVGASFHEAVLSLDKTTKPPGAT